jgi:hypothetical protein
MCKVKLFLVIVLVLGLVGVASAVPPVTITNSNGSSEVGITSNRLNTNSIITDKTVSTTTMIDAVTLDDNPTTYTSSALTTGGFDKISFFWDYDETEHVGEIEAFHLGAIGAGYSINDILTVVQEGGSAATITVNTVYVGSITTISGTPTAAGSGYAVGNVLTITTGGTGGTATVATTTVGSITTLHTTPTAGGVGYSPNDVLTITTGGSGATTTVSTIAATGGLKTLTLAGGGTGYTQGAENLLTVVQAGGASGVISCTANAEGVITSIDSVTVIGTGYAVANGLVTIGGSLNNDATVNITVINGAVVTVATSPVTAGIGYTTGTGKATTVSPAGGTGCTLNIVTCDGVVGAVTSVTKLAAGTGYTAGAGKATSGGAGTSCTLNITAVDGVVGAINAFTLTTAGLGYTVADGLATSVLPNVGSGAQVDVTTVGTALSATLTLTGSVDNVTYLPLSFYDYTGGATLQTSEVLTSDGSYMCWFNRDITIPYIKATITGTNTDVNDTELNTFKAYLQK